MVNSEDAVINLIDELERDEIDQLVDRQLQQTPDDYSREWTERCTLCGDSWHGLPRWANHLDRDCPGSFADEATQQAWREMFPNPTPPPRQHFRTNTNSVLWPWPSHSILNSEESTGSQPVANPQDSRQFSAMSYQGQRLAYIQLYTGDPGPEGTSNFSAEARRSVVFTPNSIQTGPAPTWSMSANETITHIGVYDAPVGGHFLASCALTAQVTVMSGSTLALTNISIPQDLSQSLPLLHDAQQEVCDRVARTMTERGLFRDSIGYDEPQQRNSDLWLNL